MQLQLLSGGAAHGLVSALAPQFKAATDCGIAGTFSAVGAMKEKILAGAAADIVILTRALIVELIASGHVVEGSASDLGTVLTGVAVRGGDIAPPIGNAAELRAALRAADSIYFPDAKRATAGIHFMKVLQRLALASELETRLRPFPNGATAMRELAATTGGTPIGCTQITEIVNTPGVTLIGPLPKEFELATVYTIGIGKRAAHPALARQFAALLTDEMSRALRQRLGFG